MTFAQDGSVWTVSADDHSIGFYLFFDGGYQSQEIRALLAWMLRWDVFSGTRNVFVDVGANIGTISVPLARARGCRALAIEPVGENFRRLKINVEANGLADRILLAQRAVLRAPGRIHMCLTVRQSGGNFVWRDGLASIAPEEVAGFEEVEGDTLVAIARSFELRAEEIALVWRMCRDAKRRSSNRARRCGRSASRCRRRSSRARSSAKEAWRRSPTSQRRISTSSFWRRISCSTATRLAGAHRRARGADLFDHARAVPRRRAVPAAGVSS